MDSFTDYHSMRRLDVEHGTWEGWTKGCRCKLCKAAARRHVRNEKNADKRDEGLALGDPRHGTPTGYTTYGCRCDRCKAGKREREKRFRERRKERHDQE